MRDKLGVRIRCQNNRDLIRGRVAGWRSAAGCVCGRQTGGDRSRRRRRRRVVPAGENQETFTRCPVAKTKLTGH